VRSDSNQHPEPVRLGGLRVAWLETFVCVAKQECRSKAAAELSIKQSAVTKHIHSLEDWMGVELVARESHPATLTEAGKAFLNTAKLILETLEDARKRDGGGRSKLIRPVSAKGRKPRVKATAEHFGLPSED